MTAPLLSVSGLVVRRGGVEVLHGIDLEARAGAILAIIGPNGAGKSTLLGTIAGAYPASAGAIVLDGRPITGLPAEEIVRLGISLVPERRQIFSTLTVRQNLLLGGYHRYWRHRAAVCADVSRPRAMFPRLAVLDRRTGGTLSGGEQQMLAIGRGLMSRPRVLLLDEPSLGLAPLLVREIVNALERLRRAEGLTVVLVEQNVKAAMAIADEVCVMERGRIVLRGTPSDLLAHPGIKSAYLGKGYEIATPRA
ncbi:MAG: ABC transporter ATP-binding protein [Bacillati bacterium ANGP1]|uniref:ABC transporter ATP-binding protein n=1 Tax=Candidatus Segetimicrobium genomatis TaxID=2569760 RepID=A0A537JNV5_9BACT|nr:MAG: ABC transporter ATP-binding protein [Terrabacteria group bacterium ANGP1]